MDNRTIANTIKQAVDVKDLAARYGYKPNSRKAVRAFGAGMVRRYNPR